MDGLLDYANIFSFWIYQLSLFWGALNSDVTSFLFDAFDKFESFMDTQVIAPTVLVVLRNCLSIFIDLLKVFGLDDLSVLGLFFSFMGVGFALYALATIFQWILKLIPLA